MQSSIFPPRVNVGFSEDLIAKWHHFRQHLKTWHKTRNIKSEDGQTLKLLLWKPGGSFEEYISTNTHFSLQGDLCQPMLSWEKYGSSIVHLLVWNVCIPEKSARPGAAERHLYYLNRGKCKKTCLCICPKQSLKNHSQVEGEGSLLSEFHCIAYFQCPYYPGSVCQLH